MVRPSALVVCGHYGPGTGASWGAPNISPRYDEWELNIDMVVELCTALRRHGWKAYPITYIGRGRSAVAQRAQLRYKVDAESLLSPSCVVSCHFNSSTNSRASGHEVLYYADSTKGYKLASDVRNELNFAFPNQNDRGVKATAPYPGWKNLSANVRKYNRYIYILHHTKAPAILVEPAFLSSSQDRLIIDRKTYFPDCAEAIAKGVVKWYDFISRGGINA